MTATEPHVDDAPELKQLYHDFEAEHLNPLWTQLGDLMPMTPTSRAVPFVWKWSTLYP
ncbi:cupin, partial [Rhodococcus sp. IEGM 248]|nr:cupin [Rhodococcus sp. IEGM 248]